MHTSPTSSVRRSSVDVSSFSLSPKPLPCSPKKSLRTSIKRSWRNSHLLVITSFFPDGSSFLALLVRRCTRRKLASSAQQRRHGKRESTNDGLNIEHFRKILSARKERFLFYLFVFMENSFLQKLRFLNRK